MSRLGFRPGCLCLTWAADVMLRGGFCVDCYGDQDDIRKVIFCGCQVSVVRARIRGTQSEAGVLSCCGVSALVRPSFIVS